MDRIWTRGGLACRVYSVPLVTRFRGIAQREGMVIQGPAGWGEFSPFWDYGPAESAPWLAAALEAANHGYPPAVRGSVPVNVTVPAVGPARAAAAVLASGGCATAKVKVAQPGQTSAQEADRLAAVRDALGPAGRIRIDANGAWDVETAVERLALLDRAAGGLEYAEQPCRDVRELAALRRRTHVPIAADESIRLAADPLEAVRLRAADVIVMKVQPLGGVRACLALAQQIGLPIVVSSALETSVGLAAGLALAAALPEFLESPGGLPRACGLATAQLLSADATARPLAPREGAIDLRPVTPDAFDAIAADAGTRARWAARLASVEAHLAAHGTAAGPTRAAADPTRAAADPTRAAADPTRTAG